ncbi:MAG: hypothetical protein M0P71_13205 [Melioribacteraceae bacterium]|jgi:hypothetical protein|nr:hypothetical protein [Melioribacteraceae bacterium]
MKDLGIVNKKGEHMIPSGKAKASTTPISERYYSKEEYDELKKALADINALLDKLMPTEEDFNEAVKTNLPLFIRSTKGKLQYPYVSGHAHTEIEKHFGHELWWWFRSRMKGTDK